MSRFDVPAALKTFGLAVVGYLVVMAIGVSIGLAMDDDGFTGLGIIALTTVIAAPIGAVVGSWVGLRRFGRSGGGRTGIQIVGVVAVVAVGLMLVVDPPAQFIVVLFGLVLALVLLSGVGEPAAHSVAEDSPAV